MIIWLGRDDPHSNTAMRLLADIRLVQQPLYEIDSPGFLQNLWGAMSIDYENNLPRLLNNRHSVENLLHRPYWSRLWIVQEFVLAQSLLLVCGSYAIPSTALTDLIYISELPGWLFEPSVITIPRSVSRLFTTRNERKAGVTFSLPEIQMISLLREFSAMECENSRDKVYGLLGLCDRKVQINIDYTKSSDEVFREVFTTLSYFKGYDELWFLQLAKDMGIKWRHPISRWSTSFNE